MKLVVITKKYDSTVTKTKIHPTSLNADGIPMYVIGLSDERAQQLIDAGVAEEYITEEITKETKSNSRSKKNKSK